MNSDHDTPKGWVAPFGHPRIKACSRLPMAFRSVPRPSSPPGAKASTECPSHTPYQTSDAETPDAKLKSLHNHAQKPSPTLSDHIRCPKTDDWRLFTQHLVTNAPDRYRHNERDDPWQLAPPRSRPVRQITHHSDGPSPPPPKPTLARQMSSNRVVLRAQERTRTRFTTQKNKSTRP